MVPRMGLDLFIEAAERLAASFDFTLVLAGEGPLRLALEAQVARGPLASRVRFPGRLSDEQVGWAYEACDAFVLPTRALECFGIIVVEAFARDRPVLGANVGAIPELLGPVLPDWLFEGNSVPALSVALKRLLSGDLVPPAPGVLARHARERFGREKLGREYLALLGAAAAAA
jgi:glycosyltransferase involved in cell wall biosynthesis